MSPVPKPQGLPAMPENSAERRLHQLTIEANRKFEDRRRKFRSWNIVNLGLGGLSAVIAAVAGVGALLDTNPVLVGILAISSAILGAAVTFYDPDARAVRTGVEKARWRRLYQDSLSLDDERAHMPPEDFQGAVGRLWNRFCDQEEDDANARL